MFPYIDPKIRKRLIEHGKLFQIDSNGAVLDAELQGIPEKATSVLGPIPLPLEFYDIEVKAQWYACARNIESKKIEKLVTDFREEDDQESFASMSSLVSVNSVVVVGNPIDWKDPLVRVHSCCFTGDVLGSQRCDCGPQMRSALQRIQADEQGGLLIYMSGHEGRGIGLWAKAAAYLLQDAGEDTYQANCSLGFSDDSRDFSDAASLLKYFVAGKPLRLLTNNPKKVDDLMSFGITDITRVKHVIGITDSNRKYMEAKRNWGHELDPEDL
ncbi:MAG: GTP cyclohydrolase II [Woeseiaceae bacterium]|nr:GTP cyclohydrolase II [Woeseiaceae bacterium]